MLGTVLQGTTDLSALLDLTNLIAGLADDLAGEWVTAAGNFGLSGFDAFSGLSAGSFLDDLLVTLDTSTAGAFSGSAILSPRSENASGFSGALPDIILVIEGTISLPGDFDDDGDVDGADFLSWQRGESLGGFNSSDLADWEENYGTTAAVLSGDFDLDGDVDGGDFLSWQRGDGTAAGLALWENNFGVGGAALASSAANVPEPSTAILVGLALLAFAGRSTRFKPAL